MMAGVRNDEAVLAIVIEFRLGQHGRLPSSSAAIGNVPPGADAQW